MEIFEKAVLFFGVSFITIFSLLVLGSFTVVFLRQELYFMALFTYFLTLIPFCVIITFIDNTFRKTRKKQ